MIISLLLLSLQLVGEESTIIGKAHIKTDPAGAEIFKADVSLGKTPCLIDLGAGGSHMLVVRLKGYVDKVLNIEIKDASIHKLDVVKLEAIKVKFDVVFLEEGWEIVVDKVSYVKDGKPVTAPATIEIIPGQHEIKLVKDNFQDIVGKVDTEKVKQWEVTDKPKQGRSSKTIVKNETQIQTESNKGLLLITGNERKTYLNDSQLLLPSAKTKTSFTGWLVLPENFKSLRLRSGSAVGSEGLKFSIEGQTLIFDAVKLHRFVVVPPKYQRRVKLCIDRSIAVNEFPWGPLEWSIDDSDWIAIPLENLYTR